MCSFSNHMGNYPKQSPRNLCRSDGIHGENAGRVQNQGNAAGRIQTSFQSQIHPWVTKAEKQVWGLTTHLKPTSIQEVKEPQQIERKKKKKTKPNKETLQFPLFAPLILFNLIYFSQQ